jgi:hypothetical protein
LAPWISRRREQRDVSAAIGAEIEALKTLVETRDYVNGFRKEAANLKAVGPGKSYPEWLTVPSMTHKYFQVFDSSVVKVGMLGDATPDVLNFYSRAKAFLETVSELGRALERKDPPMIMAERLNLAARELEEILRITEGLIPRLRALARATHPIEKWISP